MQQKDLTLLFSAGDLTDCFMVSNPLGEGWLMICHRRNGEGVQLTAKHGLKDGRPRVFKSLTAATNVARQIGFKEMAVSL